MASELSASSSSSANSGDSQGRGRGVSWKRQETLALIRYWGEAELKYAVSTLRRNYCIFVDISKAMHNSGYNRSALECRTKTKILRRDFKKCVANNKRSGNAPSGFPFYEEMQRIFRGDPGILPPRIADSHVDPGKDLQSSIDAQDSLITLDLYPVQTHSGDEDQENTPPIRQSQEEILPSTDESMMDPAARLSLLRRRRKRTSAVAQITENMNGNVDKFCEEMHDSTMLSREMKVSLDSYLSRHCQTMERLTDIFDVFCKRDSTYQCTSSDCSEKAPPPKPTPQAEDINLSADLLDYTHNSDDTNCEIPSDGNCSDVDSQFSLTLISTPENKGEVYLEESAPSPQGISSSEINSAVHLNSTPQRAAGKRIPKNRVNIPQPGEKSQSKYDIQNKTDGSQRKKSQDPYIIVKKEPLNHLQCNAKSGNVITRSPIRRQRKAPSVYSP